MIKKYARYSRVFGMFCLQMLLFSCAKEKVKEPDIPEVGLRNRVYMGNSDGNFFALNSTDGKLIWKYKAGDFSYSNPIVVGETVYAGSSDGNMYSFDAINGSVKWKFAANGGIESSPAVADSIIYFGSSDDYFYALNAANGQLRWKMETSQNVSSSPLVANNVVYFGSSDSWMYAVEAKTGKLIWRYRTGGLIGASSPALSNGVIFIGSRDGHLYALDAKNGNLKWKYSAEGFSLEDSSPVVANGMVYVGSSYNVNTSKSGGSLLALDEISGKLRWEGLKGIGVGGSPAAVNGFVYVSADDGFFHAFDALTGLELWFKKIIPNGSGATVADGLVFVGAGGYGDIYGYEAKTGVVIWKNSNMPGVLNSTPCVIDSRGVVVHR